MRSPAPRRVSGVPYCSTAVSESKLNIQVRASCARAASPIARNEHPMRILASTLGIPATSSFMLRQNDGDRATGPSGRIVEVAGGAASRRDLLERRRLDLAARHGERAARVEVTAGRRIERRGHLALDRLEPL